MLMPMDRIERAVMAQLLTEPVVPSRSELAQAIGTSTSSVQRAVERLSQTGYIRRAPHTPRGLEVERL